MQNNESEISQDEADKISQTSCSIDCRYMKSLLKVHLTPNTISIKL